MGRQQGDQDVPEAAPLREIEKAQPKFPTPSVLALLLANTVLLFGVIFLGWSAATILTLLCIENILVGFLNIPKMALCPFRLPFDSHGVRLTPVEQEVMSRPPPSVSMGVEIIFKIFLIPVAAQFYGGFVYSQIIIMAAILDKIPGALESIDPLELLIAAGALAVSHGISFFVNFVGRGEFRRTSFLSQAFRPYRRVFIMTLTIAIGGALSIFLGNPVWAQVVLVLLKVGIDARAHMAERKKAAGAQG